jgi:hypothetical protein
MLPRVRIEKWRTSGIYQNSLEGLVYGHPRFKDGDYVYTSGIKYFNEEQKLCVTRNTIYDLGEKFSRVSSIPETSTTL